VTENGEELPKRECVHTPNWSPYEGEGRPGVSQVSSTNCRADLRRDRGIALRVIPYLRGPRLTLRRAAVRRPPPGGLGTRRIL
jgi:hypothetical protein